MHNILNILENDTWKTRKQIHHELLLKAPKTPYPEKEIIKLLKKLITQGTVVVKEKNSIMYYKIAGDIRQS